MSLNIAKLEKRRERNGKTTAQCPACSETGADTKGEHLVLNADGSFGCVVYPAKSAGVQEHRKRIFALCGDREIKPLTVRPALGCLGRHFQTRGEKLPIKTGILGRLGRHFLTHAHISEKEEDSTRNTRVTLKEASHPSQAKPQTLPPNENIYIVCGRDDDYFAGWQETQWATVKRFATWTRIKDDAVRFKLSELNDPGYMELTCGFSSLRLVPITGEDRDDVQM